MRRVGCPTPAGLGAVRWCAAATLYALSPHAGAWGNLLLIEAPPGTTAWSLGGSVWSLPKFPGAVQNQTTLLPALEWRDPQGRFASTDSGLGWNLSARKETQFGVRLWPQLGRRASDAPPGVGAVGPRIQAEAFFNHAPLDVVLLQSGLLVGSGQNRDGVQLELGATSGIPIGPDLLGIGLSATYANGAYRRSYFGISTAQGLSAGLSPYDPGAGWTDRCITLSFEHKFSAHWRFDAQSLTVFLARSLTATPLGIRSRQQAATVSLWHDF
jgi:outer membrane scaffolding protein for murein synthesis (MipA/OmpV family)